MPTELRSDLRESFTPSSCFKVECPFLAQTLPQSCLIRHLLANLPDHTGEASLSLWYCILSVDQESSSARLIPILGE
jgi:hypothetical protein